MMTLARVFPAGSKDELWTCLEQTVPGMRIKDVTPLYMSQQQERDWVTIVFDARSYDSMVPMFCDHLGACESARRTQTLPLLQPRFFPVPKDRPGKLQRFRLAMEVHTGSLRRVYKKLAGLKYPAGVYPTYQAFVFGDEDLLASILAPDRPALEAVVFGEMAGWDGVTDASLTLVHRNLRIAPAEEWRQYRRSRYRTPADESEDIEFDWLDAAMSGAFVHEL